MGNNEYCFITSESYPVTTSTGTTVRYNGDKYTNIGLVGTTATAVDIAKKLNGVRMPVVERVIFNKNVTIVIWSDETKTIVKRHKGDKKSNEIGLAMAIAKKYYGNRSRFLKAVKNGKVYK